MYSIGQPFITSKDYYKEVKVHEWLVIVEYVLYSINHNIKYSVCQILKQTI